MAAFLHSLRILTFGIVLLVAATVFSQTRLPAPPRPDSAQLERLRAGFENTFAAKTDAAVQQPAKLPPPKPMPIAQASFASPAVRHDEEAAAASQLPNTDAENAESEKVPPPFDPMLDKPLVSKKTKTNETSTEEHTGETSNEKKEFKIGAWKNKLIKPEFSATMMPVLSVAGSLLVVLAAFFLIAVFLRKVSPKGNRPLPKEAFENLGRIFLSQKHQLHLLRLGHRVVLVSVMPDYIKTITEVTDPDEVVSLLGMCRRNDVNSATELFRKAVRNMSEEELSRPERPAITQRRKQYGSSVDFYDEPDESLAAQLARGRH
jgi:flagellar biogenesis protein FliO